MKVTSYNSVSMIVTCIILLVHGAMSARLRRAGADVDDVPRNSNDCIRRWGYKFYYDHGTAHCEQCREICQHAEIKKTVEYCETECQQYLKVISCEGKEDHFYDEAVDSCTPCSELCAHHQITGSTQECTEKCSAYLDKLTPKQVPSMHRQNYLKAVDGSGAETSSSSQSLHPGWIATISVGGVAVFSLIVIVVILFRTYHQQYAQAAQEEPNKPQQPIEETSQGSRDSVHFAIDGGTRPLPTAFSDLLEDRSQALQCLTTAA